VTRLGARRRGIVVTYGVLLAGCLAFLAASTRWQSGDDGRTDGEFDGGVGLVAYATSASFDEPPFVAEHRRLERLRVDGNYEGAWERG
jgi:hypothetical protein